MTLERLHVSSRRHLASGTAMLGLGAGGLFYFWEPLGLVSRGLVPFLVLASGVVMVGAGVRTLRERRGLSPNLEALAPILVTSACVVLAAAAASGMSGVSVDAPGSWTGSRVLGYMALGLVSGIVGGMLGLGGGVVHLSGMTLLFGFPFGFARGATLINNVFINAAAALRYHRRGLLVWPVITVLLPAALVGVIGGSLVQVGLDEGTMRKVFAVFILLTTACIIFETAKSGGLDDTEEVGEAPVAHAMTGGLAGFLSGVLGISGGIVAVPGQTLLGGVPLRGAIANSTVVTTASSALGSILLLFVGDNEMLGGTEMATIALLFMPGNLIGGHFGAKWMERLPVFAVRSFFISALLAIAVRAWGLVQ